MPKKDVSPKLDEITCLYEITRAIHATLDLRKALYKVLDLLSDYLGMNRSSITLLNPDTSEIHIEVAHGISAKEKMRGRYKLGEGVTGRVIETGRPMAVPHIDAEPLFLDRTGARRGIDKSKTSFVCVPIKEGRRVIGALSVDRLFAGSSPLDADLRLLAIISTLIAQKVALLDKIRKEQEQLRKENIRLRRELNKKYSFTSIIGNSRKMQEVFYLITQVAKSNANVLLLGESGTGKELVANAIHYNSLRHANPLVKVNCAALPENLVEAELFGYEKGAFTGANREKVGKFELANSGTIFLDEVGSLAFESQGKLLRVLQEKELERLGSTSVIKVNVRLIAATNQDLASAVEIGAFREDLFYRLNVINITIPPLRERREDILLLIDYFLKKYNKNEVLPQLSNAAKQILLDYDYPGNIRQLENIIQRAVILCNSDVIDVPHLPEEIVASLNYINSSTGQPLTYQEKKQQVIEAFERKELNRILTLTSGKVREGARTAGMNEKNFSEKLKKYGIKSNDYK